MADWVMTATTLYCDAVDDEVTFMVYRDGTSQCTGYKRYGRPDKAAARLLKARSLRSGRQLGCEGLGCHRITQYRERLLVGEDKS
jgi:hypothetical protein